MPASGEASTASRRRGGIAAPGPLAPTCRRSVRNCTKGITIATTVKVTDAGTPSRDGSSERNRDRILAAALEVFAQRGFDGATTAAIARRAGVTQPLVHYHFATKDDLWRGALTELLEELGAAFGDGPDELADVEPLTRLKVLVRRYVYFSAAHPEFGRILAYEGARGGERLRWVLSQTGASQLRSFDEILRQGSDEGWLKPLPPEFVGMALAAAAAYAFIAKEIMGRVWGIDVSDPEAIEAQADTIVEVFFHGLVASPGTESSDG